jgi:hypothetical protein
MVLNKLQGLVRQVERAADVLETVVVVDALQMDRSERDDAMKDTTL